MSLRSRIAAAVLALALAACTGAPDVAPTPAPAPDPAASALADSLAVEIVQGRVDWGNRVLSLVISAPGEGADGADDAAPSALEVTAAALVSPAWTDSAAKDPDRTVTASAGRTRSMFVALGAPVCDSHPDGVTAPPASAVLTLRTPDGVGLTREVAVTDPFGHLARAWGEDCARLGAEAVVSLAVGPEVTSGEHDGEPTGSVRLTITPVTTPDAPDDVTITGVRGTQLLAPVGGDVRWTDPAMGAPAVGGSAVDLTFTAVRCDRHAIAEDKRGTFLGVETSRDGVAQPLFFIQLPAVTRANLMRWFADACGWED